jgi:hypothetical protein
MKLFHIKVAKFKNVYVEYNVDLPILFCTIGYFNKN